MNQPEKIQLTKEEETCNYKGCTVKLAFPPFQIFCKKHEVEIRDELLNQHKK